MALPVELTRARRAHRRLVQAREERDRAVWEAACAGHSLRAIAGASGVDLKQTHRIVVRMDAAADAEHEAMRADARHHAEA